jgi:hypothetical protein
MSRSQGGRTEDRGLGSCTQMDVKYEFDTKEGLHVKLYRMAIIKLNVDAIVNAANDIMDQDRSRQLIIFFYSFGKC